MIRELIGKSGAFILSLENIHGSGWDDHIQSIMENKLQPINISKRIITQSWDYSEKGFDLEKENVKFILRLDDNVTPYFFLKKEDITAGSMQKLREWATIIAAEVERLKR